MAAKRDHSSYLNVHGSVWVRLEVIVYPRRNNGSFSIELSCILIPSMDRILGVMFLLVLCI